MADEDGVAIFTRVDEGSIERIRIPSRRAEYTTTTSKATTATVGLTEVKEQKGSDGACHNANASDGICRMTPG